MSHCTRCDGLGRLTAHSVPCTRCNGSGEEPATAPANATPFRSVPLGGEERKRQPGWDSKRVADAAKATQSMQRRGLGPDIGSAGGFFSGANVVRTPADPKSCPSCGKTGVPLRMILRDVTECSAIECPLRKRVTAQPSQR